MALTCSACGLGVAPGSRYCHGCGARLPLPRPSLPERFASPIHYTPPHLAERILAERSALEGEHKRLTVVFCDIAKSTPLAEQLGPEGMYELINRFFDLALAEIHRYEGTINQFLGDGFMALFGAPIALEQHERQAVLAAVGLRRALEEAPPSVPAFPARELKLRFGLNTGSVVVGKIGDNLRMDYTAVGDTTNIAARLQARAEPGSILLSETTYERARSVIEVESLGSLDLPGLSRPIVSYRVSGLRRSRSPEAVPPLGQSLSPFVGRQRELDALQDALAEAEQSRGLVVGLLGEPGIGKSRLLLEFRRQLAAHRVTYLEGRCLPYGRTIPYLPILDLLRADCRLDDLDAPEAMVAKVRAAVDEVGLDLATSLPYLLHLLGLKEGNDLFPSSTPEAIQRHTFEALRQLCLRGSATRPLILAIEDVHWIDQTSEEFLASMAEVLGGTPILLIVTHRPGYSPPWVGKSYATQLALRPLSAQASRELVRSMASCPASEAAERQILERGEGNPLFIEELVHAVPVPVGAGDLAVPQTLQGLLAARIDRLAEDAKHLLQFASVIGREFSRELIAKVWDIPADPAQLLHDLVRRELLHESVWAATPTYVFKHALTREAAYGSLLESRRRRYHAAVGRALEDLYTGRHIEIVELLAHHFDRSADDDRAVDYAIAASEKAQRRWANAEALAHAEAALKRLASMPDSRANRLRRIDAVLRQCEVRFALGQQADQLHALDGIAGITRDVADASRSATWHYWMGFLHTLTGGTLDEAENHCRKAVAVANAAALADVGAQAETCLAQIHVFSGAFAAAIDAGERALAVFESRGNLAWACRALAQLSAAANALGQWERSFGYCRRSLNHAIALDDRRLRVAALVRVAATCVQSGEWETGLRHCEEASAVGPSPYDEAAIKAVRGYGLVKGGQHEQGIALLQESIRWYERVHLQFTRCQFGLWLAEAFLRKGDRPSADAAATESLHIARELGYRHLEATACGLIADASSGVPAN
jgi:class 3 adenylate cyclase/tetratricopeptide (TPR) repeat protein